MAEDLFYHYDTNKSETFYAWVSIGITFIKSMTLRLRRNLLSILFEVRIKSPSVEIVDGLMN